MLSGRATSGGAPVVAWLERATSERLVEPDWDANLELCDMLNMNPGQTKDAMKVLKKRLGNKNPQVQLLTLIVLETLSKNCGDHVYLQIIERDILHDMVKIVKKKPNMSVREKILILIDTWQEAFGGSRGKYPKYYAAYQELRSAGVGFPPRAEDAVPLFTPPQTHPIVPREMPVYEHLPIEGFLHSEPSARVLEEVKNARRIADVLNEMLAALNPHNPEGVREEVIVDLVEQCRIYQKRVVSLINDTGDEQLLLQGLELNDKLQHVLEHHDNILKGLSGKPVQTMEPSEPSLYNAGHEEEDTDGVQLTRRTRDLTSMGKTPSPVEQSFAIPPPPSSKKQVNSEMMDDYLSGDSYKSEVKSASHQPPPSTEFHSPPNSHLAQQPVVDSPPKPPIFASTPKFDQAVLERYQTEPSLKKVHWDAQPIGVLPPPPVKHSQRQQFFEQQQPQFPSSSDYEPSHDVLIQQTQKLSLQRDDQGPSPLARQSKPQDSLFKDLVDLAKSSSPSKPGRQRTMH